MPQVQAPGVRQPESPQEARTIYTRPAVSLPCAFSVPDDTASKATLVVKFRLMDEHTFQKLRRSMGLTRAQMAGLLRVPLVTVSAREAGALAGRSAILRPVRVKRTGSKN
jgi:hypothetical protein